jgi:hypothetical protein
MASMRIKAGMSSRADSLPRNTPGMTSIALSAALMTSHRSKLEVMVSMKMMHTGLPASLSFFQFSLQIQLLPQTLRAGGFCTDGRSGYACERASGNRLTPLGDFRA